jgi:hypothetical protein
MGKAVLESAGLPDLLEFSFFVSINLCIRCLVIPSHVCTFPCYLDQGIETIIFVSILITFIASVIFRGFWGICENCLELKITPTKFSLPSLVKHIVGTQGTHWIGCYLHILSESAFLLSVKKISNFFATLNGVGVGGEDQNPGQKL